jgi:hypothetical protein
MTGLDRLIVDAMDSIRREEDEKAWAALLEVADAPGQGGAYARLRDVLMETPGTASFDLIWDASLEIADATDFLGDAKYEPFREAIYKGLGIPADPRETKTDAD